MSDRGVFAVDRAVFDHPMFAPEPYTEVQAWIWLLSAAAWSDKRIRVGKSLVELKRGQLAFATRFLAVKWRWTHSKVVRFLKRLEIDTMIGTRATRDSTLITICNYGEYQFGRNTDETLTGTQTGTLPEHCRNKEEESNKNKKEEVRKKDTREDPPSIEFRLWFERFWDSWPNKVGKPAALKAFLAAAKRGADLDAIVAGIESYVLAKPPDRPWLNPATFLNQNRWEDQPAKVTNGKTESLSDVARRHAGQGISFGDRPTASGLRLVAGGADVRLLPKSGGE